MAKYEVGFLASVLVRKFVQIEADSPEAAALKCQAMAKDMGEAVALEDQEKVGNGWQPVFAASWDDARVSIEAGVTPDVVYELNDAGERVKLLGEAAELLPCEVH